MVNLRVFHVLSINFLKITIVNDYFVVYLQANRRTCASLEGNLGLRRSFI